jgi:hypothetical protein
MPPEKNGEDSSAGSNMGISRLIIMCRRGSIENSRFQHLAEQTLFNRSKQKFVQLIMSVRPPNRPKFIMIGRGSRLPIWVKLSTGQIYFPVASRASAQPTPSVRVPHIIHQSTRFRPRMCLLGVLYPKHLIFVTSMGISSLNFLRAYLSTGETYHDA